MREELRPNVILYTGEYCEDPENFAIYRHRRGIKAEHWSEITGRHPERWEEEGSDLEMDDIVLPKPDDVALIMYT